MFNRFKKDKTPKAPPAPVPREKSLIQADYARICAEVGEAQYRVESAKSYINQLNNQLQGLQNEAGARDTLDAELAKKAAVAEQDKKAAASV